MSEVLKPCPFCGHDAYAYTESAQKIGGLIGHRHAVACRYCETAVGGVHFEDAARLWNTRAAPKVKPLVWTSTPPEGMEGHPDHIYAKGVGGEYCLEPDGTLWWAHEPFTFSAYGSKASAIDAANADNSMRILSALDAGEAS